MKIKTVVIWFCGLWAFGLGLRLSIELLASDGWIHVPRDVGYGVNLWFDFIPLCIFGLITAIFMTKEMVKEIRIKNENC